MRFNKLPQLQYSLDISGPGNRKDSSIQRSTHKTTSKRILL